ncbi:MAG: hypothetical protein KDE20_26585, partial [Caldilineaceae bacterium]|nr:hypothetical protein [Caldilineaceae bacterium]
RALRTQEHDPSSPLTLDVLVDANGRMFAAYLIDETVYRSTFHRMFLLGEHDAARTVEIANDFPWLRAYRVRPAPFADGFESGSLDRWRGVEAAARRS